MYVRNEKERDGCEWNEQDKIGLLCFAPRTKMEVAKIEAGRTQKKETLRTKNYFVKNVKVSQSHQHHDDFFKENRIEERLLLRIPRSQGNLGNKFQ